MSRKEKAFELFSQGHTVEELQKMDEFEDLKEESLKVYRREWKNQRGDITQLSSIQKRANSLSSDIHGLVKALKKCREELELEDKVDDVVTSELPFIRRERFENLEKKYERLEKDLKVTRSTNEELRASFEDMQAENERLEQKLEEEKEAKESLLEEISYLNLNKSSLQEDVENLENRKKLLKTQIKNLAAQGLELAESIHELEQEKYKLEQQNYKLEQQKRNIEQEKEQALVKEALKEVSS